MLGGSVWFLMPASPSWRVSKLTKIDRKAWRRHEGLSTVCILNVARLHALNRYVRPDSCSAQISHRGKLKRSLTRTFPLVLSHEKLNTLHELLRSFLPGWEWRDCAFWRCVMIYMVYVVMVCYGKCVYRFPLVRKSLRHLSFSLRFWSICGKVNDCERLAEGIFDSHLLAVERL